MTEEPELTRRDEAVIRAELAQVDADMIEAQRTYQRLALRRLQLAGELVAPAMDRYWAPKQPPASAGTDPVAEGPAGTDTPRGSDQ